MISGKVRGGFFQEISLHLQFPGFPLELTKTRPLIQRQRRLLTGMLPPVSIHPVPQSALDNPQLPRHLRDRPRRLDHHLHSFLAELRREILLDSCQHFSFQTTLILLGSLSGRLGASHPPSGTVLQRAMVETVVHDFEGAMEMPRPRLTFACELSSERLDDLFADGSIVAGLRALDSRVALALAAFTPERAGVVRRLNDEGVPVVAIPLLSFDEGYYFTADNFLRAADRYEEWKAWTVEQRLAWDGVGLDIEPDVRLYQQIADNPWGVVPMLLPRILQRDRPRRAAVAYAGLVARIRADGWQVENYQFPLIADERRAGSDLLQRLAGL